MERYVSVAMVVFSEDVVVEFSDCAVAVDPTGRII